jgi:hypothetical protein
MGLPEGQCFKCKVPLLIETNMLRPLCSDCEKEINEMMQKSWDAKGKKTKGKCLVFPKPPKVEDDTA